MKRDDGWRLWFGFELALALELVLGMILECVFMLELKVVVVPDMISFFSFLFPFPNQ